MNQDDEHDGLLFPTGPAPTGGNKVTTRPPYQRDSETSHEAAARIAPHLSVMRRAVLETFGSMGEGGATRQQVADAGPYVEATVCARVVELIKIGALELTGEKRPTRSGFRALVLRITKAGVAMLVQSGE